MATLNWNSPIVLDKGGATSVRRVVTTTYGLLALTVTLTGLCAWFGSHAASVLAHPILLLIGGFGALLATLVFANRAPQLALLFLLVFSVLEGLSLGPVLALYAAMPSGPAVVTEAALLTASVFVVLSLVAGLSRVDFSFLGQFLFVGLILLVLASVVGFFVHASAYQTTLAAVSTLLFSGYILYDTSRMIRAESVNPVVMVVNLYLDILNLFLSLLRLLSRSN